MKSRFISYLCLLLLFLLHPFGYAQTLDQAFRATNPSDSTIINTVIGAIPAMATCDTNAMTVVRVSTNDPVVQIGQSNTIYVFEAGTHMIPFTSNASTWALVKGMTIVGKNCVGLVGDISGGEVILTTTGFMQQGYQSHPDRTHGLNYFTRGGIIDIENSQRIGIHGLTIQGLVGGEKNHIGIGLKSVSGFHMENLLIKNNLFAGIFFFDAKFGTITNVTSRDHGNNNVYRSSVHGMNMLWNRGFGIQMQDSHTITLTNVTTSHSTVGLEIWGRYGTPHTITRSGGASHSNRRLGIWLDDNMNNIILHNLDIYNNNNTITSRPGGGIHFKSRAHHTMRPDNVTISNTRIFGHNGFGIQINGGSGIVVNNSIVFDNGLGVTFSHDHPDQLAAGHKGYVTIANSVITNNTTGINAPAPYNHELLVQNSLISHNTVGLVSGNPQTRILDSVYLNNGSAIVAMASLHLLGGVALINNTTGLVNAYNIVGSPTSILTGLVDNCSLSLRPYQTFNPSCTQQGRLVSDPTLVSVSNYRIGLHVPTQKAVKNYTQTVNLIPAPSQSTYIVSTTLLPTPVINLSLKGGGQESLMTVINHDGCTNLMLTGTVSVSFSDTSLVYPVGDVNTKGLLGPLVLFSVTSSFVGGTLTGSRTTTQPANTLGNGLYPTSVSVGYSYDPHGFGIIQSGAINVSYGSCSQPTPTQFFVCRLTDNNKPGLYVPVLHGSKSNSGFVVSAINGDTSLARLYTYPLPNQPRGWIHALRTNTPTTFSVIDLAQGPNAPVQTFTVAGTSQRCNDSITMITNPEFTSPPLLTAGQATIAELTTLHNITYTACKTSDSRYRLIFNYPADYVVYTAIQKRDPNTNQRISLSPADYTITGNTITINNPLLGGSRPRIRIRYKNRPSGIITTAISHTGGTPISTPCP